MRTYEAWSPDYIMKGGNVSRSQTLFALAWFHAVVQERRMYIPQVGIQQRHITANECFWRFHNICYITFMKPPRSANMNNNNCYNNFHFRVGLNFMSFHSLIYELLPTLSTASPLTVSIYGSMLNVLVFNNIHFNTRTCPYYREEKNLVVQENLPVMNNCEC